MSSISLIQITKRLLDDTGRDVDLQFRHDNEILTARIASNNPLSVHANTTVGYIYAYALADYLTNKQFSLLSLAALAAYSQSFMYGQVLMFNRPKERLRIDFTNLLKVTAPPLIVFPKNWSPTPINGCYFADIYSMARYDPNMIDAYNEAKGHGVLEKARNIALLDPLIAQDFLKDHHLNLMVLVSSDEWMTPKMGQIIV